jgi:NodT family efflux transporter outer membrane factor (OMF) lipoprotein
VKLRFIRRVGPALGLAWLAGCAVGPDFQRPQTPASTGFTADALPAATGGPAGTEQRLDPAANIAADWWTLFHSPQLNEMIDRSLKANPDLRAAEATLRQAHENTEVAVAGFLPTVDGSLNGTRERESGAEFGSPGAPAAIFSVYAASLSVSYVPDVFGGTRRQVENAAAAEENARFQLAAARLTLAGNVVTSAVQEAELRAEIATTEEIADADRQQLDLLQRRFDLGAIAAADVLAQRSTLATVEASLPGLRKQLAGARAQLAVYAGAPPSDASGAPFTLASLELPRTLPVELPSSLVDRRPDIREAEAQVHEASALVGVAVANMLPQIKLTATYGDTALNTSSLFDPASTVWSLGAGLTQPLLEENTLLHKKRGAEAALAQAAAQYRSTVLKAFQDVANALYAVTFDAETHEADRAAEQAASDSLALARKQYELGAVSFPTLLDAEKTWQQTRLSLVQAEAARIADSAALLVALGGGWWNQPDTLETDPAGAPQEHDPQ